MQMAQDPRGQFRHSLARVGLVDCRREIISAHTGRPQAHDELTRHAASDLAAVIFLDQGEGHLDACGPPGGAIKSFIFQKRDRMTDPELGKALRQVPRKTPVGRDMPAVDQATLCQRINTGRDRGDPARLAGLGRQPQPCPLARLGLAQSFPARDDDGVELRRVLRRDRP